MEAVQYGHAGHPYTVGDITNIVRYSSVVGYLW